MILIGLILTIAFYLLALYIKKVFKSALLNPVLVAASGIIVLILFSPISYENYISGAGIIGKSLGPIVVLLAIPLYIHRNLIKENLLPIFTGILVSIVSSVLMIIGLGNLFNFEKELIMTLIPKSITTPMAMEVSDMLLGIPDITVIIVILTGIFGATIAPFVMKIGHIKSEVSKGISIGAASHGIGTSKAMEISNEAGAMSGLAMGLTGIIFVLMTSISVVFLY